MTSKYFKLDMSKYARHNRLGPPTKREKKSNKLRVMSEWDWDLGIMAFGRKGSLENEKR